MSKILIVLAGLVLVACQSMDAGQTQVDTDQTQSDMAAPEFVANPALSTDERLREAFEQLEVGQPGQARAELEAYLVERPKGKVASDLVRQIDLPADQYYPQNSFDVTLESGESLSTLAQKYLGTAYQFYALAKYNGLDKPKDLKAGQVIRIPLTDFAQQVLANPQVVETESAVTETGDAPADKDENTGLTEAPEMAKAEQADDYYKQASIAFRRQELDKAIALWDKVLEIDPEHQHAIAGRLQAIELKKKLSNLK